MSVAMSEVLTEPLLERCRQRAPVYDRENRFCQEDFDELKAAGYLKMAVPKEFGGAGLTLAETSHETRRLALYAPATALCINMHNYWVGDAADLLDEPIVDAVIAANPQQVETYRGGKEGVLGFFVGQVMRETQGKADARVVNELLRAKLSA